MSRWGFGMADVGDGFVGRCEVVEPRRRGKRRWSNEMKARIVAESLQPGIRVVDVAARHDILPHHLSDWRRHARLALPGDLMDALNGSPGSEAAEPAFVPLSILPDPVGQPVPSTAVGAQGGSGVMTIEVMAGILRWLFGGSSARDARCLIPRFDGAILSQEWKEALWDKFVTEAPRPRTLSEQQYSDRKLPVARWRPTGARRGHRSRGALSGSCQCRGQAC